MLRNFLTSTIFVALAGPIFAQSSALDMSEDQYRELIDIVVNDFSERDLSQLSVQEVQWLVSACDVISQREAHNSDAALKNNETYIPKTTRGVCDSVDLHHGTDGN